MNIRPVGDQVLCRKIAPPKEQGGILIPDNAQESGQTLRVKVLATGPGRRNPETGERVSVAVKKGDVALVDRFAGVTATIDGTEYVLVREGDVLAIFFCGEG